MEEQVHSSESKMSFKEFDLSSETLYGLKAAGFKQPTEIQRQTLKPALEGKDVLASAKTGSGKTLGFIIPLLECLHREKWSSTDGLGALVITPTRELAYQIFEVLRLVGQKHQFSAALVIGGKDLAMERKRIDQINIIICTPGRMQQHMEENPLFYGDMLKMLIIDEADRILDMGFEDSINQIVDFLPKDRQCLLFSATLTNSVKDLARLSLKDPVQISVDKNITTPETLKQKYTVINLEQKLSFVWSFIKRHKKSKILIFIATCKQTRFIHDLFCRMKPGVSIIAIHGGLHQLKRMDVYNKFRDVRHCVLLATDVASRGLDFPDVDWVVQLDCPEDPTAYIHRVGRTARLERVGRSLLVLMPNERDYMLEQLEKRHIPVEEVPTREKHLFFIQNTVESHLARDVNLKEEAKRAFKSYIKSLLNSHFRQMFDLKQLNLKAYAESLGLEVTPRIRVLERRGQNVSKPEGENKSTGPKFSAPSDSDDDSDQDFLRPAKKQRVVSDDDDDDVEKEENIGKEKPKDLPLKLTDIERELLEKKKMSKAKLAKKLLKKNIHLNKRIVFNS